MNDNTAHTRDILRRHRCCVIIPTYNNEKTLPAVIEGCLTFCDDVIVADDGCTDATPAIIQQFPTVTSVQNPENKGKGVMLRTAFREAEHMGYQYAITIDADGQHDPADIPVFAAALEQEPGAIYIGARNMDQASIPGTSKFGHKNSNFWFWVETGIRAKDTQSGYRLYPLEAVNRIPLFTWKYEFEIEVIVKAAWRDIPVKFVSVRVYYPENRVSHFRPFRDFSRVALLNAWLVIAGLLWYRPVGSLRRLKKKR